MIQLKYDDEFNNITEDIKYWTNDTIPNNIHEFIKNKSNQKIIYEGDTNTYYCLQCFNKLSSNYTCPKCHTKKSHSYENTIFISNIKEVTSSHNDVYYYAFDIVNDKVFMYELKEIITICYNNYPIKINRVSINKVFQIKANNIIDIYENKPHTYHEFLSEYQKIYTTYEINGYGDYEENKLTNYILDHKGYVYPGNLNKLKKTIYKYTFIWKSITYLKKHEVTLFEIAILPLANKNFEYLIKYKLYNLAYCNNLEFKNNFSDTFGITKEYLPFMVKYDINIDELNILRITRINDIRLLRKLSQYTYAITKLHDEYHINILKLIAYFKKKKLNYNYLNDYYDYIRICKEVGINIKDKKFLYPNNFFKTHNEVVSQYELIINKDLDEDIRKIGSILQINKYEDNEYIIFPANSLKSLIEESLNQNNCVRTYAKSYSEGECQIYFMRKKNNLNKSLVTIEVIKNNVIQARIKNNRLPNKDLTKIIKKWEKQLLPITIS